MDDPVQEAEGQQTPPTTATSVAAADKLEIERQRLTERVAGSELNVLQDKVAWLLNRYPATRDSDKDLALAFWAEFEDADEHEPLARIRQLTSFSSIVRGRAKIQNTLGLFKPTERVQAARGDLEDAERSEYRRRRGDSHPVVTIFVDETGKTDESLIVGGLWALTPYSERVVGKEIKLWKETHQVREIHFAEISRRDEEKYLEFVDFLSSRFGTFGFKFLSMRRRGAPANALERMFYHLIAKGIAHEHHSGRCELPRTVEVWKDLENIDSDRLLLADIRDRLIAGSLAQFEGQLEVGQLEAVSSESNNWLQVADFLLGSVNRHVNGPGITGDGYKDRIAQKVISTLDIDINRTEEVDGLACRLHL